MAMTLGNCGMEPTHPLSKSGKRKAGNQIEQVMCHHMPFWAWDGKAREHPYTFLTWQWGSAICHWACSCRKPADAGSIRRHCGAVPSPNTVVGISCWQNHRLEKVEGAEGLASTDIPTRPSRQRCRPVVSWAVLPPSTSNCQEPKSHTLHQ